MPTYRVIRKADNEEITRYCAATIHETLSGNAYPLTDFDHVEFVDGEEPPAQANPADWYIHVGPFFDRFGAYKIPILASADLLVQALIKDATVRKYIDLIGRRAELEQMIGLLQSKGFAVDPVAILDVQPNAAEVYRG